jgi:hypothetical protein
MDLGVVEHPDMVAIPEPVWGLLDQPRQCGGDVVGVPGAVFGEGLQGFPVGGPIEGEHGLCDGMLLDIDRQGGDPLGEAPEAALGEGPPDATEEVFPERPNESSVGHLSSPDTGSAGLGKHLVESIQETTLSIRES